MVRRPSTFRPVAAFRAAAMLLALLLGSGCSTWKPLREPVAEAVAVPDARTHVLVHLHDGRRLELEIREATADSLRGWAYGKHPKMGHPSAKYGQPVSIARADIARIESRQTDAALTAACVVGVLGVVAVVAFVVAMSSMDSIISFQP